MVMNFSNGLPGLPGNRVSRLGVDCPALLFGQGVKHWLCFVQVPLTDFIPRNLPPFLTCKSDHPEKGAREVRFAT